jgi:hypothetical protein
MANLKFSLVLLISTLLFSSCYTVNEGIRNQPNDSPLWIMYSDKDSLSFVGTPFKKKLGKQMLAWRLISDVKLENGTEIVEHNLYIMHEVILADKKKALKFSSALFENGNELSLIDMEESWTEKQPLGLRKSYITQYLQPLPSNFIDENGLQFVLKGENRYSQEPYDTRTISIPAEAIEVQIRETSLGLDKLFEKYGYND